MRAIALEPTVPRPGRLNGLSLAALALLMLALSPAALELMGWQYGETGGGALEKIHPATMLAALLLFAAAASHGNPLTSLLETLEAHPGVVVYLAGIGLLVFDAIYVVNLPFTTFIDTFLAPAIVFLLLLDLPERRGRTLALLIHAFFIVNALIGIAEFALGFRITPIVAEGITLDEWRSSALLGHPLANAILTGCYMIMLVTGGARDLPYWLRPVAFAVSAVGMIVFGGRAATGFLLLFLAAGVVKRIIALLAGAKLDTRAVLFTLVALPLAALVVLSLADAGFFDQFLGRFTDDEGSASTRIEMFELFRHVSWPDLLLGPDHDHIVTLMAIYGLEFGIECFWISMIFSHGLIVAGAFFVCLLCFCLEVVRRSAPRRRNFLPLLLRRGVDVAEPFGQESLFATLVLMVMVLQRPITAYGVGGAR